MSAQTTFTTWNALYQALLDNAAKFFSGDFSQAQYSINTGTFSASYTFRTVEDYEKAIKFCRTMVSTETKSYAGRTVAKNGGGGRW